MNDFAALSRMLENLIRFGVIAAVQMEPPRVQVKTGALTTAWLPWLTLRAGADQEWDPPTVDEQVILFSPSGQLANGVVVTGLFSDHIPANGNRAGLHRRTYADGAVIEYDSVAHHLNATLPDIGTTTGSGQQLDKLMKDQLFGIKTVQTIDYVGYSKEYHCYVFNDVAIHLSDFAAYLDLQRAVAVKEHNQLNGIKRAV